MGENGKSNRRHRRRRTGRYKDGGISFEAGSDAPKPHASRAPVLTLKFGLKKRRFSAVLDQVREWHGDLSQRTEAKSRLDSS